VSILETVSVFVGIPLLIVLVISGLAFAGGGRARSKRYRPGRPFDFAPVWFLASSDRATADGARELAAGARRPELVGGQTSQGAASQGIASPLGATGGASDRW
jgi:hypothetical protein